MIGGWHPTQCRIAALFRFPNDCGAPDRTVLASGRPAAPAEKMVFRKH
jgi:hypothetical protein